MILILTDAYDTHADYVIKKMGQSFFLCDSSAADPAA